MGNMNIHITWLTHVRTGPPPQKKNRYPVPCAYIYRYPDPALSRDLIMQVESAIRDVPCSPTPISPTLDQKVAFRLLIKKQLYVMF